MEGLDVASKRKREKLLFLVEDLAFKEEVKWRQRSKVEWAKDGDGNTKFFHKIANGRRKRNYIERLEVEDGGVVEDAEEIENKSLTFSSPYLVTMKRCVRVWKTLIGAQ
ncbi:hypothetical protein D8674_016590 [Pyrus ussuriensis x Pyrus communis]|uniref:Uncharacterized protein n=1 Tax=Pyrus ussuriensis x Pyrus communis TaxID=2448454 RepID=A0A5N5HHH8_9ROSA|nr:hypothetical protein D8674_016590 [Pyrus ussuriensis x Pyrus communis]